MWFGATVCVMWWGVVQVCLFVGCLTSQQHASVSQGRICSDNLTCCHTEIEVADQTFYLTQSQYTDTGPTSPSADPITPGACQFLSQWYDSTPKKSRRKRDLNPGSSTLEADALPLGQRGGCGTEHFRSYVTGMTRAGKTPAQVGFEPRVCRSRGERLNHQTNEAIQNGQGKDQRHSSRNSDICLWILSCFQSISRIIKILSS